MDIQELKVAIFYNYRAHYYQCMQNLAQEGITKHRNDMSFRFYHALAVSLKNHSQDGIDELEKLLKHDEYKLSSIIALMYAYKRVNLIDKERFKDLDAKMREHRKIASAEDLTHTAYILFGLKKYDKAREYVDKAIIAQSDNVNAGVMKAWIEFMAGNAQQALEMFDRAFQANKKHLDVYIGLTKCYLVLGKYDKARDALDKAVVRFPDNALPIIEKMKLQFAQKDFDQTIEIMNRVINMDPTNLDAMVVNILILLCRDGHYEEAALCIKKFHKELEQHEPQNSEIFLKNGILFSRLCRRSKNVLLETYSLVEKAVQLDTNSADALTELGYHCLLLGRTKDAQRFYKSATKINNSSINALLGLTICEVTDHGVTDQARQQVEFLVELQDKNISSMLLFMQSKLWASNPEKALMYLNQVCEVHMKGVEGLVYGEKYLRKLSPDFLLDVAKEYFQYVPRQAALQDDIKFDNVATNSLLQKAEGILETVVKSCPGLQEAVYLLAKIYYLNGNSEAASKTLSNVLNNSDSALPEAHLLMAQIYVDEGQYQRASLSLEMGLSYNFKVRENPMYHFIQGLVNKNEKEPEEAIKCFTTALSLIDLKPRETSFIKSGDELHNELTLADKVSLYVELIDAHTLAGQTHEAAKILENANEEFRGTTEETRILILNADMAIRNRDITHAIEILSKVKPNEPYYLQVRKKLANIYLEHQNDRYEYIDCYIEMAEMKPGVDSLVMLGNAYIELLKQDEAVETFKKAYELNPANPKLALLMGSVLKKTHRFSEAIDFYIKVMKEMDNSEFKVQLANLYMLLKQFDKAEKMMQTEIEATKKQSLDDLVSLQKRSQNLLLLAQVQEKSGKVVDALKTLKEAKENQARVRKRSAVEQSSVEVDETKLLTQICIKMGNLSTSQRDNEQAINYYKEALMFSPEDLPALTSLAKLYMQINYMELCQQTCTTLLKVDPESETASVMMADIAFRKVDFDTASYHFTQLLNKQPTYWTALARLVEVTRRIGSLDEVPKYLKLAEKACASAGNAKEAGLEYCVGLYEWYSGNPNAALRHFNNARQDNAWGQQAIYNMIEICLNPEEDMIGDAFSDLDDVEYRDSRTMALRTAERLLKELKPKSGNPNEESLKYRLLGNFVLLASKTKMNVERALDDFTTIASQESYKDMVGPILGVATANILLKQSQKARNQLKRVSKNVWTFEDAEYLERCWLLLADSYIQSSKYDLAGELLKRVLQHNRTCTKAYEYSGFIAEKEQRYKDATASYEFAWKYSGKLNPTIGYKLAYSHMKSKRYADAIETCHQVLKLHPEYPKIKKDVLDKSVTNLRT